MGYKKVVKTFEKFLHDDDFYPLRDRLLSDDFNWFHREKQVAWDTQPFIDYFTHSIYNNHEITSDYYHLIMPFLKKMYFRAIISIIVNLVTMKPESVVSDFHIDYEYKDSKTAIYYLNTNNGYTEFEDGTKINCDENKLVVFNSQIKHRLASQTDKTKRVVINFKYF